MISVRNSHQPVNACSKYGTGRNGQYPCGENILGHTPAYFAEMFGCANAMIAEPITCVVPTGNPAKMLLESRMQNNNKNE